MKDLNEMDIDIKKNQLNLDSLEWQNNSYSNEFIVDEEPTN